MADPQAANNPWDLISRLAESVASASDAFRVGAISPEITGFSRAGAEWLPEPVNNALDSRNGSRPFGPAVRAGLGALRVLYEKTAGTPGTVSKAYESGRDEAVVARNAKNGQSPLAVQLGSAVGDVPGEIYRAGKEAVLGVGQNFLPAQWVEGGRDPLTESRLEGFKKTGKGLLSVAAVPLSPLTGTARSLLGHPFAAAEHGLQFLIDPDAAAKADPRKIFEQWKGNVDTAMLAARPGGAPVRQVGPQLPPQRYETPDASLVWDHTAGRPVQAAPKPPTPTRQELTKAAENGFEEAATIPLEVKGAEVKSWAGNIQQRLENDHSLYPEFARGTHAILDRVKAAPEGVSFNGEKLEKLRRDLSEAARSSNEQEARAGRYALDQLTAFRRDMPTDVVLAGNRTGSAATYMRAVGDEMAAQKSSQIHSAIRKGSTGDSAGRSIQDNAKSFLSDSKNLNGFSAEEIRSLSLSPKARRLPG